MTLRNVPWPHSLLAGAVLALSACGGGSDGDDKTPTPTPEPQPPTTQELVTQYIQASTAITATRLPDAGADRYVMLDACYLGQGNSKAALVAAWNDGGAQRLAANAYMVGRQFTNVQVLAERKTTNADGSARHEVDIGYDEKYTDGTTTTGQTETLVAGSTAGACDTPQTGAALRALGNRRAVSVSLVARNTLNTFFKLADGQSAATPYQLRREVQFAVTDPAKAATYVVVSWPSPTAGAAPLSLKLLSPRVARDAAEMQGTPGNATYSDTDRFRICRSDAQGSVANAATADCAKLGLLQDTWGASVWPPANADAIASGEARYAAWGFAAGTEFTFQVHADDGWKTVNGQQGQTPIATYRLSLKNAPYPFAEMTPTAFPQITSVSPTPLEIATAFKGAGGTARIQWQVAKVPAGGLPMVFSDLSSYRQGPKEGSANGLPTVRTRAQSVTAPPGATEALLPFGGKPEGASATTYGEFTLTHVDRNGRQMRHSVQFQP